MALVLTTSCLKDSIDIVRWYKRLVERALEQAPDEALFVSLDPESNSIAIIVKHLSGNMRSRWTDFLTTDGEKPNRNRDSEFEAPPVTRVELMALWDEGWKPVLATLDSLADADLVRTITIRGEAHSVLQAIHRFETHFVYHAGQIIYLAKHFAGPNWTALTVPRGKSAEWNARVSSKEVSQR